MAGHNFKALQTFRAWSEARQSFVYGYHCNISGQDYIITDYMTLDAVVVKTAYRDKTQPFTLHEKKEDRIAIDHNEMIAVVKESIGIFTGKNDKNGTPIFAGLPEDGNIGGDNVSFNVIQEDGKIIGEFSYTACNYFIHANGKMYYANSAKNIEVIGSAYEQYLKETKC